MRVADIGAIGKRGTGPFEDAHDQERSFTLFWGLVLVTALIAYRWGSMVDLIFFVFALMTGSLAIARWPDAYWALSTG
jgi:hypothetical protein